MQRDPLFKFKDAMADARTEVLEPAPERIDPELVDEYFMERLLTDWEVLIEDSAFAKRAREDVKAVVMAIHAMRPEPKEYPFTFGGGTHSATIEDA